MTDTGYQKNMDCRAVYASITRETVSLTVQELPGFVCGAKQSKMEGFRQEEVVGETNPLTRI